MELLSGAEILIRALKDQGITKIYGYPGGSVLHIYDALFQQDAIEHILVRHEQAATHMADAYARATGKAGVALVTSGPGATNANYWYRYSVYRFNPYGCYHRTSAKSLNW